MKPFFTVIIPTYNNQKTIASTLESVINQTISEYEVIVINDNSTDETSSILESYKAKFQAQNTKLTLIKNPKNLGVADSRNLGFQIATGEYIALLDGDDMWRKDKLKKQKKSIEETGCHICCTSYTFIDEGGANIKSPYIIPAEITYESMLKENFIGCSTVVVKASLLDGESMEKEYYHEDFALWLKLIRQGAKVIGVPEILVDYRVSAASRSHNKINSAIKRIKIYRKQEKLSLFKTLKVFSAYMVRGVRKWK